MISWHSISILETQINGLCKPQYRPYEYIPLDEPILEGIAAFGVTHWLGLCAGVICGSGYFKEVECKKVLNDYGIYI